MSGNSDEGSPAEDNLSGTIIVPPTSTQPHSDEEESEMDASSNEEMSEGYTPSNGEGDDASDTPAPQITQPEAPQITQSEAPQITQSEAPQITQPEAPAAVVTTEIPAPVVRQISPHEQQIEGGVAGAVARAARNRPRRQRRQELDPPQDPQQQQPQPGDHQVAAHPPAVNDNNMDQEFRMFKLVLDHETLTVAKGSLALMLCAWILLHFPSTTPLGAFSGAACVVLVMLGVTTVFRKPDLRLRFPLSSLELCSFHLFGIIILCCVVDIFVDILAPQLGLFPFNVRNETVFKAQMEIARKFTPIDYIYHFDHWCRVNAQFFFTSFAILLLVNVPNTLWQMSKRSHVLREILVQIDILLITMFEMTALFYPTAYIVAPFYVMNLAARIPVQYQSLWLWAALHLMALSCVCFIIYGVMHYPEIPLIRPMGLPGYAYMAVVTVFQLLIGTVLFNFFMLLRTVYFNTLPGAFKQHIDTPGFFTAPPLYFKQISEGIPQEKWEHSDVYPFSYEFVITVFTIVYFIRHFKLMGYAQDIHDRLELAMGEVEN